HAEGLDWAPDAALAALPNVSVATNADVLGRQLLGQIRPGDDVVLMSNGDFGGLREMLVAELTAAEQSQ
ncbi:MAG: UDP-N-acetylmuramate:L-alanyl-gamma-D-glutamyl-meso-diaminopimelate ligase, partial [Pseudomonadota bacterium]